MISQTGDVVWAASYQAPAWTWWPTLTPDVCALTAGTTRGGWDNADSTLEDSRQVWYAGSNVQQTLGCSYGGARARLQKASFYVCPRDGRNRAAERRCGGSASFYCAKWGCETTGEAYWNPTSRWDLIRVKKNASRNSCDHYGWCNPLAITFTDKGKSNRDWVKEKAWGLRFYQQGYDQGLIIRIRLKIEATSTTQVGPNRVLAEQGPPVEVPPLSKVIAPLTVAKRSLTTVANDPYASTLYTLQTGQRLLNLVQGAFNALNRTNPDLTVSCWLCLATGPPYYEGTALVGNHTVTTQPDLCMGGGHHRLTLTQVSGVGTCIGKPPKAYQHLCNNTVHMEKNGTNYYLNPGIDKWWACNTGLTPCISTAVFNETNDYCVLIQLVPRVLYHPTNTLEDIYDGRIRHKREPVTLTLAVLLGLGVAAGVGTGTTALVQMPHYFDELRSAMDQDLRALEQSLSELEKSVTSLSEVVLQNRRGLDLLFLKEGGLCAALKEECCFYADHSGTIRDSMAKLRERLDRRQKEREAKQGWFESWYARAPWMTTLISTLAGPLIILLLLLTFGPLILNKLISFIRERISAVHMLVLRQQYQVIQEVEEEDGV